MRKIILLPLVACCLLAGACNTVRGAGEDVRSVGRVFSDDPSGTKAR